MAVVNKPVVSILEYMAINLSQGKGSNEVIDWIDCSRAVDLRCKGGSFSSVWDIEVISRSTSAAFGENVYLFVYRTFSGMCGMSDTIINQTVSHFAKTGAVDNMVFDENLAIASVLAAVNGLSEKDIISKFRITEENALMLKVAWSFLAKELLLASLISLSTLSTNTSTSGIRTLDFLSAPHEFLSNPF
jgi:hypothetical protein